jgi:hypothetical protein
VDTLVHQIFDGHHIQYLPRILPIVDIHIQLVHPTKHHISMDGHLPSMDMHSINQTHPNAAIGGVRGNNNSTSEANDPTDGRMTFIPIPSNSCLKSPRYAYRYQQEEEDSTETIRLHVQLN